MRIGVDLGGMHDMAHLHDDIFGLTVPDACANHVDTRPVPPEAS